MRLPQVLAALMAFASVATAAPSPKPGAGAGPERFTVSQEHSGRRRLRSGPHAIQKTYRKYGAAVPEHVLVATSTIQIGTVAVDPDANDADYLSPVMIGTPPQQVMLDFDTGSSDLWVFSSQMPADQQTGHAFYSPTSSYSAQQLEGQTFNVSYGDGSGSVGDVFADKVVIGGVTVTEQAVEAATSASAEFVQETTLDGLVGLGGTQNNQVYPTQQYTFFDNVKSSLAKPLFAAYLKHQAAGAYDFGYLNPNHYTGVVHYTPADTSAGYYQITTTGFYVGSTHYPDVELTSVVDTGTSLIFQPDDVVYAYYSQVPSAQYYESVGGVAFECSETLPSFGIKVAGSKREMPGSYLNYGAIGNSGYCFGGLQSSEGIPFGILGDVFLKSQYVVFDNGDSLVGFADQK